MRPRTRSRRSSGRPTRRRDGRGPLRRAPVTGAEFQPAQGVGEADRARLVASTRGAEVECLAAVRPSQGRARPQRRQVAAHQLHLAIERVGRPVVRATARISQGAQEAESVQRQRPGGRQRWSRSEGVARGEEGPGRRRVHAGRRLVAEARSVDLVRGRCGLGLGLASDDRHIVILDPRCERRLIGPSTMPAGGRHSRRRGPCASTTGVPDRPRSGCAASERARPPCATRRRSHSPTRAPGAGRG